MLKKLVAAFGLLLLATGATYASTFEQIRNASFMLHRGGEPVCSGQFIDPNTFLTAAHCLRDMEATYTVVTSKGNGIEVFRLNIENVNTEWDTATLTVADEDASFPFVDVAPLKLPIHLGEEVISATWPDADGKFMFTDGLFSGMVEAPPGLSGTFHYLVSTDTVAGSSGGGLYVKRGDEWYLIGTLSGGPPSHDYINWFTTLQGVYYVIGND